MIGFCTVCIAVVTPFSILIGEAERYTGEQEEEESESFLGSLSKCL